MYLIGERFGYNSEKRFNNPPCLEKTLQPGEMAAMNSRVSIAVEKFNQMIRFVSVTVKNYERTRRVMIE